MSVRATTRFPAFTAVAVLSLASGSPSSPTERGAVRSYPTAAAIQDSDSLFPHEFYYTRGIYSGRGGRYGGFRGGGSWSTDYPKSDRQFLVGVKRLLNIDAFEMEHAVRLDDPQLNRFPFLYMVEVGRGNLSPTEIAGLRRYIEAGGFLVVDDFWGSYEWDVWEYQISQVFPEYSIVELPMDHPIFNMVYPLKEIVQVPNVGNGRYGPPYHEQDGYVAHCRGIFDKNGRLIVVINWNTDLGDAWEWAEMPYYPLKFSTFAWEMGINFIVYAMSH